MFRNIRVVTAAFSIALMTLLFLDFTGTTHLWFGWLAKLQFLPAILALNIAVVAALVLGTILFGRVYCSVLCPLGIFQDVISWIAGRRKRNRFSYSPALTLVRMVSLAAFTVLLIAGIGSVVALFAPYSAYGRMASSLLGPVYRWGNNLLAALVQRVDSYAFYSVDVRLAGTATLMVAAVTFAALSVLAWRHGRTYCNTLCPVGTVLGALSRISVFAPRIDADLCTGCGLCARNCKASCINHKAGQIDYSRCVMCMDCLGKCRKGALKYTLGKQRKMPTEKKPAMLNAAGASRRSFLSFFALFAATTAAKAQAKKVDGGLALIQNKSAPDRSSPLSPAGSLGSQHLARHCTACQLCISACPNQVLHSSNALATLMQPEMSYERGYCRPECTRCSQVCPTGAINPVTPQQKSAIQIGHAVWHREWCVVNTDGVSCGNCARHCPTGAIHMAPRDGDKPASPKIPMIDEERCIGCGACEYVCPSRPHSAIHVEGHERHKII